MPDSKNELEILSTHFDHEDTAPEQLLLSSMRNADQTALNIGKCIIQLKNDLYDLQNDPENTATIDSEICKLKEHLAEMVEKYKTTVDGVLKLAKSINFDVENLDYRQVDIDQLDKRPHNAISQTDDRNPLDDIGDDNLTQYVIVKDHDTNKPTIFNFEDTKACQDEYGSSCSCKSESENVVCSDVCSRDNRKTASSHHQSSSNSVDYEKEPIRDDLMALRGRMRLLDQQNRDLLRSINCSNRRTHALSNVVHNNKPAVVGCKKSNCNGENIPTVSKSDLMTCEISRLKNELKELKRDQCQIKLARQILNVADSQCANCVGTNLDDDNKTKLDCLTENYNALLADRDAKKTEIENLLNILDDAKHKYKTFEDCLVISKAQVAQLEKQLFDLNSTKIQDPELACSNDKYLLESLKHRLREATEEKANIQMVLEFHLTELEDKKTKYLAVLQSNEELKHRIDTLAKEKTAICQEYEAEFNRMDELLKTRLAQIELLPGVLATTQRDLETEKSARIALEDERDEILNEITALKMCLENSQQNSDKGYINELEEQNTQLKARINTLEDTMAEDKRLYKERTHYSLQLKEHLDVVREEAAIQVTKIKDFSECQRLNYTDYIEKLERQLAGCRAVACAEFEKHDQVDGRLRQRIEILTTYLKEAQKTIGELVKMKEMIRTKPGNELCMLPPMLQSTCENLNDPRNENSPIYKHYLN